MKRSTSILATVALGSLLAVGATTVTMAREVARHRAPGQTLCNDGAADDRGFGGFSGTPGTASGTRHRRGGAPTGA